MYEVRRMIPGRYALGHVNLETPAFARLTAWAYTFALQYE